MPSITINSPLCITVPRLEGCWLQTDSTGLTLNLNFPGVTPEEMSCFKSGVHQSALYIAGSHPPIPFLLLEFTSGGFGPVEGSFDVRSQHPEFLDHFINAPSPARITMYLTDMGRIKGISHTWLSKKITDRFKEAVHQQQAIPYTDQEFARTKMRMQRQYTTMQMYRMCWNAPDCILVHA